MPARIIRAAIVGASSLLGKELAEELNEAAPVQWDIKLLDVEDASGQLTSTGDEATVIQSVHPDSFSGIDVAFFAGSLTMTREFWRAAVSAGASVVDMSGALEGEENVIVRSPFLRTTEGVPVPNLSTVAVVSAHTAAVMLGAVAAKLQASFAPMQAAVTLLEPASQQGSAGLDELHVQTVNLLSFKPLPQEVFDTQVAFNLNAELGPSSRVDLVKTTSYLQRHLAAIAGRPVADAVSIQLIQAPVFNGYTASMFVFTSSNVTEAEAERALTGDIISITGPGDPAPSNQVATQQGQIMLTVRKAKSLSGTGGGIWIWMAADNLRLAARNAVACAAELLALRPGARLQ